MTAPPALRDSSLGSFWLDAPERPAAAAPLEGTRSADLAVVGGGYTGLWAAIAAKEQDPGREVALLEAAQVGHAASGRNGGFLSSSLTHGLANGLARFPAEMAQLEALGRQNYDDLVAFVGAQGIDCGLTSSGAVSVARRSHQLADADAHQRQLTAFGHDAEVLDREQVRAELDSPAFLGGVWQRSGEGLLDPARLAWGLRRVAAELGVRIYEGTPVTGVERRGAGLALATRAGTLMAGRAVLCTNAFRPLLRRHRSSTVPVYDFVLVTEPLSASQLGALGWRRRQGFSDLSNLFHYFRLAGDRILWGGYDAEYHFGSRMGRRLEDDPAVYSALASRFFTTFPQLEGVRFTHRWAGAIDTSTRFSVFFARALAGRVVHVAGYTGLGVGAARFGGRTALDLLDRRPSAATRLRYVRSRPLPFPPEPLRWVGISATKRASAAADRSGHRGAWLRTLDRVGLGFDS